MDFDLRWPIGAMFGSFGVILVTTGIALDTWTGAAMLAFGAGAFSLAYRARRMKRRR